MTILLNCCDTAERRATRPMTLPAPHGSGNAKKKGPKLELGTSQPLTVLPSIIPPREAAAPALPRSARYAKEATEQA
jgi:hypothetical protein